MGWASGLGAAAVAGGFNLGGAAMTNAASKKAASKAFKYSLALQLQQQAFIERLTNSAHQREVADLKKAGLNPILSAGGSGADSPSGGFAHVEPAKVADLSKIGSDALAVGASAVQAEAADRNADTSAKAQESQEELNETAGAVNRANAALTNAKAAKELLQSDIWKDIGKGYKEINGFVDGLFKKVADSIYSNFSGSSSGKGISDAERKSRQEWRNHLRELREAEEQKYGTAFPSGKAKGMSFQPERYRGTDIWYGDYVDSNGKTHKGYYRK